MKLEILGSRVNMWLKLGPDPYFVVIVRRGTHNDEMCNLYIMYYTDATSGESFMECGRSAPKMLFMSVPPGSNTPPESPPVSSNEPHSRNRPPVVNPWDNYFDIYDETGGYYNGGQSYVQGSNADYISPGEGDQAMGRGGEDGVTARPEPAVGDKTSALVTSSQDAGEGNREGNGGVTPAAPIVPADKGTDTTSPPPPANSKGTQLLSKYLSLHSNEPFSTKFQSALVLQTSVLLGNCIELYSN